jgi:hypothetical protein
MKKTILALLIASTGAFIASSFCAGNAYPPRPESARVWYEIEYFPVRLISMVSTVVWDVPTASFQDGIRGAIGGTRCVARNIGQEDGTYELVAGGVTGGPLGLVTGSAYGVVHGFGYGVKHGFVGYPSPNSGSHSMLFQGKAYVVPYDDNY